MQEDKLHNKEEEEVFSAIGIVDDTIDEIDDGDHPLEDDEIAARHHDNEEDSDIFDFFGDEDEKNDGMY